MNDIIIEKIKYQNEYIWNNPEISKHYIFINTIQEILFLIEKDKLSYFEVKDKYIPGDSIENDLETIALNNEYILNYTDENHILAYSKKYPVFLNTKFYQKYEKEIKQSFLKQIQNSEHYSYTINKYIFSDELFNILLTKKNSVLYFENIDLTREQIDKLNDKMIIAHLKKDNQNIQISSKYSFYMYTKKELEERNNISFSLNTLKNNNILNLKYLKDSSFIDISLYGTYLSEEEKLNIVKENLLKLDTLNKNFTVKFNVEKRSIYNNLFKDIKFKNINIIIRNDLHDYSEEEYLNEEKKLSELVKNIKELKLSPFEKFIAIYNIVKNIKPYKDNSNDINQARHLRYIINNDYIVCLGYAKLLVNLLDKVGIDANEYSTSVDKSYDKGFTIEEKNTELTGHARVIVSIDDDKYNIHGLYMSDPTWDNNLEKNYLNNALLTFDSMQTNVRLFSFNRFNPALDIHNFEEYNEQVNYLLKRKLKEIQTDIFYLDKSFSEQLICTYQFVGQNILETINCDSKFNYYLHKLGTCNTEKDYLNFYTELGHYLLTRINLKYNKKLLFEANKEVLKTVYNKDVLRNTQSDYYKRDLKMYPYTIPTNNEFNLKDRKKL